MLPAPFLSRQLPAPNISRQSPTPLLPRLLTAPVLNPQDCFEEERTASFEASTSCEVVDQGNSQQELVAIDCAEDTLFEQNGVSWPLAFEELFTLSPQPSPADNES